MVGGAALVAVAVLGWFGWHDEEMVKSHVAVEVLYPLASIVPLFLL